MSSDAKTTESDKHNTSGDNPPKGVKRVAAVPLVASAAIARGLRKGTSAK